MAKKVALVTGGAGRIGPAIALALAEDGYDIGLNDIRNGQETADLCRRIEILSNHAKTG